MEKTTINKLIIIRNMYILEFKINIIISNILCNRCTMELNTIKDPN